MNLRIIALTLSIITTSFMGVAYSQVNLRLQISMGASDNARRFYKSNNYALAWTDEENINQFMHSIRSIGLDGLEPNYYNLCALEQSLLDFRNNARQAAFDLALTEEFFRLAHDLYQGRLSPEKLFPGEWDACTQPADYAGLLADALREKSVCETLDFLRPMDNSYEGLKYMLGQFRELEQSGGLPAIPIGADIMPGDVDDRMASINTKLFMLGLIPEGLANESTKYDSVYISAIEKFQRLHNVNPDGIIGRRTQEALALSAKDYISTIIVNLERYRWHQSRMIDRSIRINIPSAQLKLVGTAETTELEMKVIIGRTDRRTPVLSSVVTMLTINPTWTVPPTVLKEDVLPAIISDREYLARHNMRVITNKGVELNPDSLPWSSFISNRFPYTLREDPGPRNPLGLIKFTFPNDHSVYLHDTNMPSLFSNQDRTLSSGCIRVQSAMALVRIVIEGSGWTENMVREQIVKGETKFVLLRNAIPIHITYLTAYVSNNELFMARDIYHYDKIVSTALSQPERVVSR